MNKYIRFNPEKGNIQFLDACPHEIIVELNKFVLSVLKKKGQTQEAKVAIALEKRPDGTRLGQFIVQKIGLKNIHKIDNQNFIRILSKR